MGRQDFYPAPLGDIHRRCADPWRLVEELRDTLQRFQAYFPGAENTTGNSIESLLDLLPDPADYPDSQNL